MAPKGDPLGIGTSDTLAAYLDSLQSFYTGLLESLEYQLFLFKQ